MTHFIPIEPELAHLGGNTIGGNEQTYYPELWAWLTRKLKVKNVLDVGCGEGHALREFGRLGCNVYGLDGLPRNAALAYDVGAVCHDLTKGPYPATIAIDLIWCCEVVAQIEERYVDHVIETLAQGKYIAMTNELPNQPGYHHVNCQPTSYWEEKLAARQYQVDEALTIESLKFGHHYWSATGRIYRGIPE